MNYLWNGNKLSIEDITKIKKNLPPLKFKKRKFSKDETLYLKYYDLLIPDQVHYFGYINSAGEKLAAHFYPAKKNNGVIFITHGYIAHSGFYSAVIKHFLNKKFSVAIFDLPGHGLSSGKRADIDNFHNYGKAVHEFSEMIPLKKNENIYFIGHSTGCSAALDYIFNFKNRFSKFIFAAPLVRTSGWFSVKNLSGMASFVIDNIPRVHRDTSSDKKFNQFKESSDPMQPDNLPLNWVGSLVKWNSWIKSQKKIDLHIDILQGDKDDVVDWKYNLKFIEDKFSSVKVYSIKNGMHELLNAEKKELQKTLLIIEYILAK